MNFSLLNTFGLTSLIIPFFLFLAFLTCGFLFWRAGRRELVESNLLLDTFFVGLAGFLVGGRVIDFLLGLFEQSFSLRRLVFFNVYSGFNFYGAVIGFLVLVYFLFRRSNVKLYEIFDLLAAPLAFGRAVFLLGVIFAKSLNSVKSNILIYDICNFLIYFVCFWVIKRLEKKKRFSGYFIAFYFVFTSLLEIGLVFAKGESSVFFKIIPTGLIMPLLFLVTGFIIWYLGGGAKKKLNLNIVLAVVLLGLFKVKRVLTSIREADDMARVIVLSPYTLVIVLLNFVKLVVEEIKVSIVDLVRTFGFKK